jgi:quercetin dioxygenase-like cupin family protein
MKSNVLFVVTTLALACNRENTQSVAGPPLTVAPAGSASPAPAAALAPASTSASAAAPPTFEDRAPPVRAQFVHLSDKPFAVEHVACEERIVVVAKGTAKAAGETLAEGDVLISQGQGKYDLTGDGLAVFAIARGSNCEPPIPPMTKKVVRGAKTPKLEWAGGTMRAWLDAERDVSPFAYAGRLYAAAPVAEHAHDGSWEVLAATKGGGTFVLDGTPYALHDEQIVVVPPGVKHSYTPAAGGALSAVQFYGPPGPEQRFKALASDAGPPR